MVALIMVVMSKVLPKSFRIPHKIHPKSGKNCSKSLPNSQPYRREVPRSFQDHYLRPPNDVLQIFGDFWSPRATPKSNQNRKSQEKYCKNFMCSKYTCLDTLFHSFSIAFSSEKGVQICMFSICVCKWQLCEN